MHTNLKALVLPILLVLAPRADALDLNRVLHGKYAFAYSRVCTQSAAGFSPQLLPLGPNSQLTTAVEMIQTFNGDGTSSAAGHMLNVINNGTNQNQLEFTCTGTYQVNSGGSFSEDLSCSGTVLAGPIAGESFIQTGIHRSGHIGILAQTLVVSDTSPNLESITFFPPGTPQPRICGRSGTAVKLY